MCRRSLTRKRSRVSETLRWRDRLGWWTRRAAGGPPHRIEWAVSPFQSSLRSQLMLRDTRLRQRDRPRALPHQTDLGQYREAGSGPPKLDREAPPMRVESGHAEVLASLDCSATRSRKGMSPNCTSHLIGSSQLGNSSQSDLLRRLARQTSDEEAGGSCRASRDEDRSHTHWNVALESQTVSSGSEPMH